MNPAFQVFRKELREMMRDKRVRTSAFGVPILLIFGMLYLFGSLMDKLGKAEGQHVTVSDLKSPLVAKLRSKMMVVTEASNPNLGKALVRDGKSPLYIQFLPKNADGQDVVTLWFDQKQESSGIAKNVVTETLLNPDTGKIKDPAAANDQFKNLLKSYNVPLSRVMPVDVDAKDVKAGEGAGPAALLVSLLPYLIVIWAFYGGLSNASDLVAGEKEKMTLETLLITPVRRTEIVLGKFLSLATVCLISSLSSLVGLLIYAAVKPPGSAEMLKNGIGVSPQAAMTILVVLIPTVAFFASLLIAVSSYAKNPREAQTHLSLIGFLVTMPAIMSQFLGLTSMGSAAWVNFVPVLNTANSIRNALLGKTTTLAIVETVGVSLVLAAIGLAIAVKLFNREQVLSRI